MAGISCVIFVPDDTARTGLSRPLMLQHVLGAPLLAHLSAALERIGFCRYFLVCHEHYMADAMACFRDPENVTGSSSQDTPDQLHVFLSTAEELEDTVTVITGPVVLLPRRESARMGRTGGASWACDVPRFSLMDALDEQFRFPDFLRENGKAYTGDDGFFNVQTVDDLLFWQPAIQRAEVSDLLRHNISVWDPAHTYVSPLARIGGGSELLPGTIVRGRSVIGADCVLGPNTLIEGCTIGDCTTVNASQLYASTVGKYTNIGPFAYVRPGSVIGDNVKLGDFVEVKNSTIDNGTKVSHLTYIGDSDVGKNCNFGCGTVTVNYDRAAKHRTTIEDDCFIGCNSNLVAPVTLHQGAYTAAGSTITDDVPEQALAVARARQVNKKDWAAKNKVKAKK